MSPPSSQATLAALALVILGALGGVMTFTSVPAANQTLLATIVGALAGALTVAGGGKLADKFTQSTGANPVIQADAPNPQNQGAHP
ncbi:MAG: hypothetical protein ACYC8V_09495 [Caulobacteraceae bacterium]